MKKQIDGQNEQRPNISAWVLTIFIDIYFFSFSFQSLVDQKPFIKI